MKTPAINHYLQLLTLNTLNESETRLSFAALKPAHIDNSLFSYHLKKLSTQELILKHTDGNYSLTIAGARLINNNSFGLHEKKHPRSLIALVHNQDDKILLSKRLNQVGGLINAYLFPGGTVKDGEPIEQTVATILKNFYITPNDLDVSFCTNAEIIIDHQDQGLEHRLLYVFKVDGPCELRQPEADYSLELVARDNLANQEFPKFIADILAHIDSPQDGLFSQTYPT